MRFCFAISALAIASQANIIPRSGPLCSDVIIPVNITAKNLALPATLTAANLQTFLDSIGFSVLDLGTNIIQGTYNIAGRYCEPEVQIESRQNTIQLLVHGITYSRDYWSGLGPPGSGFGGNNYSWIAYASTQGYPTLSIDRLGNGISDHPDGIAVVQLPAQVEVTHALTIALRAGKIGGRSFTNVIYVGHSYGSLIGSAHSIGYPDDVDAYVLTGFSSKVIPSLMSTYLSGLFLPAAVVLPQRFGGLEVSYFAASSQNGANSLFFTSNSDPALRALNWETRGTVTLGEFVSAYLTGGVASKYDGPVFVLTGEQDAIFCSADALGLGTLLGHGDCGTGGNGIVAKTKILYPATSEFDYSTPASTGYCSQLHYGSQAQFKTVHDWLVTEGY